MHSVKFYTYSLNHKKPSELIDISVSIGNGQPATTDLYLNGKALKQGIQNSFSSEQIGQGGNLLGFQLDISTTIYDFNPNDNDISFRFKIRGGNTVLWPKGIDDSIIPGGVAYILIKIIFI